VRREHLLFASCMLGEVNRSFDRQAYAEETACADATRGKKRKNRGADPARVRGGRAAGWPGYRIIFHTQGME